MIDSRRWGTKIAFMFHHVNNLILIEFLANLNPRGAARLSKVALFTPFSFPGRTTCSQCTGPLRTGARKPTTPFSLKAHALSKFPATSRNFGDTESGELRGQYAAE